MTDHSHLNPDEGTIVYTMYPPEWPPQAPTVLTPKADHDAPVQHEIIALPDGTLRFHTTTITGIDITLQSCLISLHGSGYFKIGLRYSHEGGAAFAGGKCIASNQPGTSPEAHVEITLRETEPDDGEAHLPKDPLGPQPQPQLFDAPRLKVGRANTHIADLEAAQKAFFDRKPYVVVKEAESEAGKYKRVVRVREHISDDFALIIGDAIHNLRAALDLLACDLVRANGQSPDGVYFPFCDDSTYLDQMIKRRNMSRAAPDVQDMIRSLKPYKGGNERLRAVHDLDIADKHQLLIPVAGLAEEPTLVLDFGKGIELRRDRADAIKPVEDGAVLDRLIPEHVELDNKWTLLKIGFADGQPLSGLAVVETLKELSELVDGIVETFATHVLGQHGGNP